MGSEETGYQLGSDAAELERLDLQGRVLAPRDAHDSPDGGHSAGYGGFSAWVQERGM